MSETRTRYGRSVKKPDRYEPEELVEDDYTDEDENVSESESGDNSFICSIVKKKPIKKKPIKKKIQVEEESDGETINGSDSEESDVDDASDADEDGNLKDFVVYSSEDEDEDEDEENTKR